MSVTSLALLAAKEWKLFQERGLDPEIILISPAIAVPAMISGEVDYFAGVGPGVVSASLSGMPFRAVWVSSDRVSYSLVANRSLKLRTLRQENWRTQRRDQSRPRDCLETRHVAKDSIFWPGPRRLRLLERLRRRASIHRRCSWHKETSWYLTRCVEMPGGGHRPRQRHRAKPDEAVIRAMQGAKEICNRKRVR
jgi:hypothetical protein